MVNTTARPVCLRERDPVPIVQEAGWAPGQVGKISPPQRDSTPGQPSPHRVAIPTELSRSTLSANIEPCTRIPPPPQGRKIRGSPSLVDQSTRLKCEKVAQTRAACLVSLHQFCTWTTKHLRSVTLFNKIHLRVKNISYRRLNAGHKQNT